MTDNTLTAEERATIDQGGAILGAKPPGRTPPRDYTDEEKAILVDYADLKKRLMERELHVEPDPRKVVMARAMDGGGQVVEVTFEGGQIVQAAWGPKSAVTAAAERDGVTVVPLTEEGARQRLFAEKTAAVKAEAGRLISSFAPMHKQLNALASGGDRALFDTIERIRAASNAVEKQMEPLGFAALAAFDVSAAMHKQLSL